MGLRGLPRRPLGVLVQATGPCTQGHREKAGVAWARTPREARNCRGAWGRQAMSSVYFVMLSAWMFFPWSVKLFATYNQLAFLTQILFFFSLRLVSGDCKVVHKKVVTYPLESLGVFNPRSATNEVQRETIHLLKTLPDGVCVCV